jgi:starvation-inducible DNA-binding protein
MGEIKTDLKKSAAIKSIVFLHPVLAAATDLMLSTKEAHWNVRGPNFMSLHLFFDQLNEEVAVYVDDLAERTIELGGQARGTLKEAAKASRLPEYPEGLLGEQEHLRALTAQFVAFSSVIRAGIDSLGEAGDMDTADLLTQVSRGLDKQIWFLEAHLA